MPDGAVFAKLRTSKIRMPHSRYEAWCREHTAIHESGHWVAARQFDCPVKEVWARPNPQYSNDRAAVPYLGWCVFDLANWKCPTREQWLIMHAAGAIAQEIWRGKRFVDIAKAAAENYLEMSEGDEEPFRRHRIRLGSPAGIAVLRKAYLLLRRRWPDVLEAAHTLIVEHPVSEDRLLYASFVSVVCGV